MQNSASESPKWLTVNEVARELHIHANTVRNWSRSGFLPTFRLGRRQDRRFRWEDVKKLMEM